VFRQFHVEGFVNEYVEQESATDGKALIFVSERIENIPEGWRAKETYRIVNQDEYTKVFELAEPQKEFKVYAESVGNVSSDAKHICIEPSTHTRVCSIALPTKVRTQERTTPGVTGSNFVVLEPPYPTSNTIPTSEKERDTLRPSVQY
jgi:hypothetical protein